MRTIIIIIVAVMSMANSCKTSKEVSSRDASAKAAAQTKSMDYLKNNEIHDFIDDSLLMQTPFITEYFLNRLKADSVMALISEDKNTVHTSIYTSDEIIKKSTKVDAGVKACKGTQISINGSLFDVVEVDLKDADINFFNRNHQSQRPLLTLKNVYTLYPNMEMIMNGGMYTYDANRNIEPQGLYVENGKEIQPLDTMKHKFGNFYMQPNGVFLIDKNQKACILTTEQYTKLKSKVLHATQSGPMLVLDGKINPLFKENSSNLNIRNGVGISEGNNLVFIISKQPVNFYDFAMLFMEKYKCKNALYLDGAISGAIIPSLGRNDTAKANHYAVFIGVASKNRKHKKNN